MTKSEKENMVSEATHLNNIQRDDSPFLGFDPFRSSGQRVVIVRQFVTLIKKLPPITLRVFGSSTND